MSASTTGRHRASGRRRPAPWLVVVTVVAVVLVGSVALGVLWWWASPDDHEPAAVTGPSPGPSSPGRPSSTAPSASSTEPSGSAQPTVQSTRTVTVTGDVVVVQEQTVATAGTASATPVTGVPLGLRLLGLSTVSADGRVTAFTDPVRLAPSGSLTVRGRYRLDSCPDLLPALWPSPVEFSGATRSYTRVEEPLHTAYALCPNRRSSARELDGLVGVVQESTTGVPTVRLRWQGPGELTITAVGSASGVAVVPVEVGCDGSCVAELPQDGSATLTLQPVDPCAPATESDTLTLVRQTGGLAAVTVKGLHRVVCT